jgi:hypothetical protein
MTSLPLRRLRPPPRAARPAVVLAALLIASPVHAMDAEVTASANGQFYDVRSPTGQTVLERRRLIGNLGVAAYGLLDAPPGDAKAPDLSFRARLRYDADYGASASEADPTISSGLGVVPGFSRGPVDLMYAYLEGRRFLGGWLGFKLGRQYVTDMLGWWAFDGAEASVTLPFYTKVEAYGGLEERGGMPLSTPRFEADGIWRGSRSGYDPLLYPAFQPATVAPAFGVALESAGVTWIHGRLTYRRVYDTGAANLTDYTSGLYTPASYDGTRISTERLGYSVDATWGGVGGARAGIVYDLYQAHVTSVYADLDAHLGSRTTVSADYDYYLPTFDADSIWTVFAAEPANDVGLRANVDVTDQISVAAGGNVRIYGVQTGPFDPGGGAPYSPSPYYNAAASYFPTNGHPFDEGFNLSGRYRDGVTLLTLRGAGNFGDEGDRVGGDLAGERVFETRYVARARAGVWQWKDELRPDRDATSFGYVAGLGYRFAPRSEGSVEWEHDINSLAGQRFRLMLLLSVAVTK